MHLQLASQSSTRQNAAVKIRDLLLASTASTSPDTPASESSLQLLEQLRNIETQWINAVHDLTNMQQLEPILIKQMLQNIAKELKTMEPIFSELDCDNNDLEVIKNKLKLCEEKLIYSRGLNESLKGVKERLDHLISVEGEEPVYAHPKMVAMALPQSPTNTSPLPELLEPHQGMKIGSMEYNGKMDQEKLVRTTSVLIDLVGRVVNQLESRSSKLTERFELLQRFWNESGGFDEWIETIQNDIKNKKGITEDTKAFVGILSSKKEALCWVHEAANKLMDASPSADQRKAISERQESMIKQWQNLLRMLPLAIQIMLNPSDTISHLEPPDQFEDMTQMMEWLILVESKLQPHPLPVGDTSIIKKQLTSIKTIETELNKKSAEYRHFMKPNRHSDQYDSDGSSPTAPRSSSPPKIVKFIDENTIERQSRKKQIEEDHKLTTILSEDELDTSELPDVKKLKAISSLTSVNSLPPIVSPTVEEAQQLSVLWTGVWSTLTQRKQALESVLDIWSGFESKKASCEEFLEQAEGKVDSLFSSVTNSSSIEEIHKELTTLKMLSDEAQLHQHKIATLNDLTSDLIQRHRGTDNTDILQNSMTSLNIRWKKINESFLKSRIAIEQVTSAWTIFYKHYSALVEFVNATESDLNSITTSVKDFTLMQKDIEKLKNIQQELHSRDSSLDAIKQYNVILQSNIAKHMNDLVVVYTDINKLKKRWSTLTQITEDKYQELERGFSECRDVMSTLARCETWLNQAEDYINGQQMMMADLAFINAQLENQKKFEIELKERANHLSLTIARARQLTSNFTKPNALMDASNGDELKPKFESLQNSFTEVGKLLEKWKDKAAKVLSCMDEFQLLCTQFSQNMTELCAKVPDSLQLPFTLPELKRLLEKWQQMEVNTNGLGRVLEAMVASQKKLKELDVQISPDAVHLVKTYHNQWNKLRKTNSTFIETIKSTKDKFDPRNVSMTLPRGWVKAKTPQGTPYYIDGLSGNHTQWQHPELSELYRSFITRFRHSFYPSSAYPISLRLRCIQKSIQFDHLPVQVALETFNQYGLHQDPNAMLSSVDMLEMSLSLFHRAVMLPPDKDTDDMGAPLKPNGDLDVNRAVELSVSWIQDVYDLTHSGSVPSMAYQVAVVCLSSTKMDEKHKALFQIMSRGIDKATVPGLLETLIQIQIH
jgi:hypothetical protein